VANGNCQAELNIATSQWHLHSPISSPKLIFHADKMNLFSKGKYFFFEEFELL
jgi:hypothetical protein